MKREMYQITVEALDLGVELLRQRLKEATMCMKV